ncbi:hypothetical protein Tco_0841591 [Tanacetum coccineum]|uniref:Uncharacterized protein n=1 Tax=Tanacetum coccineum TaxID=301880 RepID=A0ABQ5AYM9_9ASTR
MERFENTIFKQREEIKHKMAKMFELLKELTTSKAPKKVLIREEAESPVTKNVNFISLARGKEERNENDDMAADSVINRTNTKILVKEVANETDVENRTKNKPIKRAEREETMEASNFQPVSCSNFIQEITDIIESRKFKRKFLSEPGDGVKITPDGVVIFDKKKLGSY